MDELTLGADFPSSPSRSGGTSSTGSSAVGGRRGGSRYERLITTTEDGLRIEPLYTARIPALTPDPGLPGLALHTRNEAARHRARGWDVRQRCRH